MFERKQILGYAAASLAAFIAAFAIGYTPIASSIDNYATDWMYRLHKPVPWEPQSIILAIDDASYSYIGSVGRLRGALARAINILVPVIPGLSRLISSSPTAATSPLTMNCSRRPWPPRLM